jgi:hypothetical protein
MRKTFLIEELGAGNSSGLCRNDGTDQRNQLVGNSLQSLRRTDYGRIQLDQLRR